MTSVLKLMVLLSRLLFGEEAIPLGQYLCVRRDDIKEETRSSETPGHLLKDFSKSLSSSEDGRYPVGKSSHYLTGCPTSGAADISIDAQNAQPSKQN